MITVEENGDGCKRGPVVTLLFEASNVEIMYRDGRFYRFNVVCMSSIFFPSKFQYFGLIEVFT